MEFLARFDINITYVKGETNLVANALPGTLKTMSGTNPMKYLIMSTLMHNWTPRGRPPMGQV